MNMWESFKGAGNQNESSEQNIMKPFKRTYPISRRILTEVQERG